MAYRAYKSLELFLRNIISVWNFQGDHIQEIYRDAVIRCSGCNSFNSGNDGGMTLVMLLGALPSTILIKQFF